MEEQKTLPKFYCVCAKCFDHNSASPMLEFNFRDMTIYYVCPKCGFRNIMTLKAMGAVPFPKARLSR